MFQSLLCPLLVIAVAAPMRQTVDAQASADRTIERIAALWRLKAMSSAERLEKDDVIARILAPAELSPSVLNAWYVAGSRGTSADYLAFLKGQTAVMQAETAGKVGLVQRFTLETSLMKAFLNDEFFKARIDLRLQLSKHQLATVVSPAPISTEVAAALVRLETLLNRLFSGDLAKQFVETEAAISKDMTPDLQRALNNLEQLYLAGMRETVVAGNAAALANASTEDLKASREQVKENIRAVVQGNAALLASFANGTSVAADVLSDDLKEARKAALGKLAEAIKVAQKQ